MSDNQEANVSAQQQQQQQQQQEQGSMQTVTATTVTDGPSFAPISNRRGEPMDIDEPMQDIQPLPSQQQQQQQPSTLFSSSGGETVQQQRRQRQQPQSQPQSRQLDGGLYDPRELMHPLQPQISNHSTQSNQSFQSFESVDSSTASSSQQQNSGGSFSGGCSSSTPYQQQPQQYHHQQLQQPYAHPSQATTSSSLTSASGHLAPPSHEKSWSRRWSITGRFFEKRKSVTEPFHVPGSQPSSSFSSSYKSTNANIVGADGGGKGCSWAGPESNFGRRASNNGGNVNHTINTSNQQGNQNNNSNSTNITSTTGSNSSQSSNGGNGGTGGGGDKGGADSKNNSPPGSNGNSRRPSLADLPKAILSSFRRSSIVGQADASSVLAAASCASMAVLGAGSAGGGGGTIVEEGEDQDEEVTPRIMLAAPRAPPQNPHFSRPPPKSILKRRSSEAVPTTTAATGDTAASSEGASESASTNSAAAGANDTANANSGQHAGAVDQTLSSETVHPMATADMDVADINLLTPTDHRARLLTHSPTPNHPQQHLVDNSDKNPILVGGAGSPMPSNNSDSVSSNNKVEQQSSSMASSQPQSQGAALPPDFTPGVQSNSSKDRGGERGQGSVGDYMSQDELLTQQMIGISSRAQDLANQYYGNSTNNQTSTNRNLAPIASAAAGAGGRRRSINFRETIEIIPAYRKSDYNRASDKHATFKILTPDMKSEIRDELNTYKMREMAVHVDSMANTAFH